MNQEEIEEVIEEQRHVIDTLRFIDFEHFLRFKVNACAGMGYADDPFIVALGKTLILANLKDSVRIIHNWRNICTQYEMLYRINTAKEKANGN